jgi:hypothetical protein
MNLQLLIAAFGVTVVLMVIVVAAMSIGVMFRRPCLRGSCGGPEVRGRDGEVVSCATCPNKKSKSNP